MSRCFKGIDFQRKCCISFKALLHVPKMMTQQQVEDWIAIGDVQMQV